MVMEKMIEPIRYPASPSFTAWMIRNGAATSDASAPAPWLMLLAISSPDV